MKNLVIIIFIFFLINKTVFCQNDTLNNNKINYALSFVINKSYLERLSGIYDYTGFTIHKRPIGFQFGARIKYNFNENLALLTGINLLSVERVSYFYYGSYSTYSQGSWQIPFFIQYNFKLKKQNLHFLLGCKGVFNQYALFYKYNTSSLTRPERASKTLSNRGFYPVINFGFGKSYHTKNGRLIENTITFNKGFRPIVNFTLERFSPYIESTFCYMGTGIEFALKFYLKK